LDLTEAHSKDLSLHVIFMMLPLFEDRGREGHGRILRDIAGLVDDGKLRPLLDKEQFTLNTAPDAQPPAELMGSPESAAGPRDSGLV